MKNWMDLTCEERVARSKHCGAGSAIIAVLFAALALFFIIKVNNLQKNCPEVTTGEVITVYSLSRSNFHPYLTAEYSVNGTLYHTSVNYLSGFSASDTLSRKPVDVHYNPDHPEKSYAADSPKKGHIYILFIITAVFAIGCPAFFVQAGKVAGSSGY